MHVQIEVAPSETAVIDPSTIGGQKECYVAIGVDHGRSSGETFSLENAGTLPATKPKRPPISVSTLRSFTTCYIK
jgi:hypothetical protein